jgi:hypothetical protein
MPDIAIGSPSLKAARAASVAAATESLRFLANPVRFVGLALFRDELERTGPVRTFARLCTSRHLEDLQIIALVGMLMVLVTPVVATESLSIASGILAAAAAALNWIFQTGSKRLGALDLFSCEISTICRVMVVADFATLCLKRTQALAVAAQPPSQAPFTSEEHYTPVYDGQLADLEPFDFQIVTHVTEFYTYRKTMVDCLRAMAQAKDIEQLRHLNDQMIYMQFLMYESARKAIEEMIEFEPNKAESLINVLCSELVAYGYLITHHWADYKGLRLRLRLKDYADVVGEIATKTRRNQGPNWERARTTRPEMERRYAEMLVVVHCLEVPPPADARSTEPE